MEGYIKSKTLAPDPGSVFVSRERLYSILDNVFKRKAVFIKAPAGYGKTTVVTTWMQDRHLTTAWISLDENDNQFDRFIKYLYSAIGRQIPHLFEDNAAGISEQDAGEAFERLFFVLQNIRQHIVLVFDDFHHLTSPDILNAVLRLVRYMPDELHFVFTSRTDTPKEFYIFLLKQKMVLLSEDKLLFSRNEIEEFFSLRNRHLDPENIETLYKITEGWACALIALSMASEEKRIREPAVDLKAKEYIFSFLHNEVWSLWDDKKKQFLLRTAILEEFSLELAGEITRMDNCKQILESISSHSGFVQIIEGEYKWYRYHHMFRDFLTNLAESEPDYDAVLLQNRTAEHYRNSGDIVRALAYYEAAGNHREMIDLIENSSQRLFSELDAERVYRLISRLKPYGALNSLRISICYAWSLQFTYQYIKARAFLLSLMKTLSRKKKNMNPEEYAQAYMEVCAMTVPFNISMNKDKKVYQSLKTIFSARHLEPIAFNLNNVLFLLGSRATLMDTIFSFFGRVNQYLRFSQNGNLYDSFRNMYDKNGAIPVARAEVLYQLNRIEEAIRYLTEGLEEAAARQVHRVYVPAMICLANIQKSRGNVSEAFDTVQKCIETAVSKNSIAALCVIEAFKVRMDMQFGHMNAVEKWESGIHTSPYDEVTYHSLYQHMMLAYVLIKTNRDTLAEVLLGKIKKLLDECPALGTHKITCGCLISILSMNQGKREKAVDNMLRTLSLGFKHGYYRSFADFGADLKEPLSIVTNDKSFFRKKKSFQKYVHKIAELNDIYINKTKSPDLNITPREIDILCCISKNYTNQEIADTLVISLQTVKNHTHNIYQKLGVSSRMQAVARAQDLKLIK